MVDERQKQNVPVQSVNRYEEYLPSTEFKTQVPEHFDESINLRDYIDILLRRKFLILTILFLVFLSALVFTLTSERLYRATGRLEVVQQSPKVTQFEEVVSSNIKSEEFLQTQVSLLQSEALVQRVIDKLNLSEHPVIEKMKSNVGIIGSIRKRVKEWIRPILSIKDDEGFQEEPFLSKEIVTQAMLINYVEAKLSVDLERDTSIIAIAFDSSDRQLSRDFVDTHIEEFMLWKMDQKLEATLYARQFLNKQIDRAKIDLETSEEEMNRFAKIANIFSLDSRLNSEYSQLEELNTALAQSESDLIGKKATYEQALQDGAANLPLVLSSDIIASLKGEYSRLQSEYEDLSTTFMEEYPAVKRIRSKMVSVKNRIQVEQDKILRSIKNEYKTALLRFETLKKRVKKQKEVALDLNEKATQYKILAREVETNKTIYQTLLKRSKEIESMAGVTTGNINVVDRASLPILPFKPNVKKNLLLAILVGLMAGIGSAFLLEHFDDSINNPDQIADQFKIPILGVIPLTKKTGRYLDTAFINDPQEPFSESIRTAKVSIQLSSADSQTKQFVVTSTGPAEGKTTISLNLAISFASADERVLLIDCDLRKPRLHKVLGDVENQGEAGLTNLLATNEKMRVVLKKTHIPNMWFLPSGPIPLNPVELLASNKFDKFMKQCSGHFDRIILDSPPFQGFADTLVLSRKVGGIVLVSTIGETKREALRQFKKGMMNIHGRVLGCIVNKVSTSRRYGYYSYSAYYQPDQKG